jgi:hypothetical protein
VAARPAPGLRLKRRLVDVTTHQLSHDLLRQPAQDLLGGQVPGDVEGFGLQLDHIGCLTKSSGDDTALQQEHAVDRLPRLQM